MLVQKTIKAKIHSLIKIKTGRISQEYQNFQLALRGEQAELYSATPQQAEIARKKIRKNGGKQIKPNHPLIIRRDLVKSKNKIPESLNFGLEFQFLEFNLSSNSISP